MDLLKLKAKHKRQREALRKRQVDELRSARAAARPAPTASRVAGRRARPGEVDSIVHQAKSTVSGGLWSLFGGRA